MRIWLALVLALCAGTTAWGYNLTKGTLTKCDVTFKVGGSTATTANENDVVTITVTPTTGYELSTLTAKAYMNMGGMQAPRRTTTTVLEDIALSPAVSAAQVEYTFTMPAADVTVDAACVGSKQTVTTADVDPATAGTFTFTPAEPRTGDVVTVTPSANPGWQVASVKLDAEDPNADVDATGPDTDGNYTFTQPAYGGAVTVTFEKIDYTVAAGTVTGGSISEISSTSNVHVDDVIKLKATPTVATHHLKSMTVSFEGLTSTVTPTATGIDNEYQFTMLAGDATVTAEFSAYVSLENNKEAASKTKIYDTTTTPAVFRDMTDTDHPSLGDVLGAVTGGATDIVINWYREGTDDPIGTGETYTIQENDLGKKIYYVITQTKDENGSDLTPQRTKQSLNVDIPLRAATISYTTTELTKTYGDAAFTNTLTNSGDGSVTYTSGNTSVATVDATTGEVIIKKSGTVTITATVTDSEHYTYSGMTGYNSSTKKASVSYQLTVNQATGAISFDTDAVTKTYGDAAFTMTYTSKTGNGAISYTSSNTNVATVTNAGKVTVKAPGTTIITVNMAADNNYTAASDTYTLTVGKKAATISYATTALTKKMGDNAFTNTLTKTPSSVTGLGTVTYASDNESVATVNASTGKVTIVGVGSATITATVKDGANFTYSGMTGYDSAAETASVSYTLTVGKGDISLTANNVSYTYDGTSHGITVKVTKPATGATVRYGTTAGSYTLTESPKYSALGTYTVYYKVTAPNYNDKEGSATVTISKPSGYVYFPTTSVTKTYGDDSFVNEVVTTGDGAMSYTSSNESVATVDASTGLVTIQGVGTTTIRATMAATANYTSDWHSYELTVSAADLAEAVIALDPTSFEYDGTAKEPNVKLVTLGKKRLFNDVDFTVGYGNNMNAAAATDENAPTVTITGKGNYTGQASQTFTITAKALTAAMIGTIADQTYTGGPLTPAVEVKDGNTVLVAETDYTVVYSNNTDAGTATATVSGKGNYHGDVEKTFTIVSTATPDTDEEASVTIGATGKTTYTGTRDLDFTGSASEAYVAVGYDKQAKELTLARIYKVPAGTPILIKGAEGVNEVPFTSGVSFVYKNMFVGNTSGKTVEIGENDGDQTNYVLKSGEFKSVNTNAYIPTGKAYLQLPTTFLAAHDGSDLTVTLTSSGKTTLCATVDLDFSGFTDMYAYAATGYDVSTKTVMLSRVLKASAGTPLILKGQSNGTYTIPSAGAQTTFMNMFVGNTSGAAIEVGETDGSMVNYYLSSGEFKSVKQKLTVPDGKCYLQLPSSAAGAPKRAGISADSTADTYQIVENNDILVLSVDVDGNMTGMEDLLKAAAAEKDVYYNLKGQRVEHPVKGIYVKNGRKVVVK